MEGNKLPKFEDWEAEKIKDPDFLAAAEELEFGYQVARLRMVKCLTQAQLADMVGTRQPSIARLENGTSAPSLSFLTKIAEALGAKIEFKLIPDTKWPDSGLDCHEVCQVSLIMAKPGYNQYNSTHHASAMHAHRGGSFISVFNKYFVCFCCCNLI